VTVEDKSGAPVTGLQKQDFSLLDNKAERPIESFREVKAGQEPVHVIVLVDAVNTPFSEVAYERDGVDKFLKANGGKLPYPTTVGFVTDRGTQVENTFLTDGNQLSGLLAKFNQGLREIHRDSQWGGLDRLKISLTAMREVVAVCGKLPGRKLVIWISPGWPLLTGPGIELTDSQEKSLFAEAVEFSAQLRQADVTLYDVNPIGAGESLVRTDYYEQYVPGVRGPGQMQIASLGLQVLSVQSGGLTFQSNSDVAGQIERSLKDAQSWYEITFEPAPGEKPNEYHSLQAKVDKSGATVRTRTGYYAQR
jgi:VWFA-related protein